MSRQEEKLGPPNEKFVKAVVSLCDEVRDLSVGQTVPVITKPTALEFYRYVSQNKPVIIEGAVDHWPALSKWTNNSYLRDKIGDQQITVASTPTGMADSVVSNRYFVMPHEHKMTFNQLMDILDSTYPTEHGVFYAQFQNDSLNQEYKLLIDDVEPDIPFATEALGRKPEAVNIWIGEDHSITSLHKDHYENLYVVVTGKKHFTLYPPTDYPFLYEKKYDIAKWERKADNDFKLLPKYPPESVPWISVDPMMPDFDLYPLFKYASPIRVTVHPGQMLYLPSMYYHYVQQNADEEGKCMAINYWYDMDFDIKYAYSQFLKKTTQLFLHSKKGDDYDDDDDEDE